ncbi:MAG: DMT family transporter [Clostridia bacterium]|nr:DMT family transporter [Clostridia bacterium]
MLTVTAAIWGFAFVAQDVGMDFVGPITFNGVRFFIGAAVLVPVIIIFNIIRAKKGEKNVSGGFKSVLKASLCCGTLLFIASTLQQIGIKYTSAGKAGFVTAMYIVLVPLLGIFLKRKTTVLTWLAIAVAVVGLYFLCINEQLRISTGDLLVLVASLFWAVQILTIDHFADKVDCLKLACGEFFVSGLFSLPLMLAFEKVTAPSLYACAVPLAYAGLLSCGVAYTLQPVGQKYTAPTLASLIMSLESVFAVLGGFLFLNETLTLRELLGCGLLLGAVVLAQIPAGNLKKSSENGI